MTAIWPIKGRVDKVIDYARNPEKTTEAGLPELAALHAVDNVVEYAADEMKTERRSYVSCLNCREDTAAAQFMETKRLWGKPGGRVCHHGYQSFKADEVTAETAHEIGVRLAEELWGGRFEVVVATHCNTGHYHNHFVINSVSWADGKKFYNFPADYARMREVWDRLCREYAISVIEDPGRQTKDYAGWQAERDGKPTHRGAIRADIDRAIRASTTEREFLRVLGEMGYRVETHGKDGKPLKYPALKPPDAKGYFRFHKLGEDYTLEEIGWHPAAISTSRPPSRSLRVARPGVTGRRESHGQKSPACGRCISVIAMDSTSSSSSQHPSSGYLFCCRRTSPGWTGWTRRPGF
ncbi:MAG: relaxase/mobilization nuclease domain-containing protein [Eubacteriales bacterium]